MTMDSVGRLWRRRAPPSEGLQLVVPVRERHDLIRRFHDSLFAGHLGVTCTIFRLLDRVYWPGLRRDVRTYIASCTVCWRGSIPASGITSAPFIFVPIPGENRAVRIDPSCVIHPFYIHKMDSGPVRLMTIAHAFNYRVAVLRDGVRSAV